MAMDILRKLGNDAREVTRPLPLPEGYPALRVMVSRRRSFFFGSGLKLAIDKTSPCCLQCREAVKQMSGEETVAALADLLQAVIEIIESCKCVEVNKAVPSETGRAPQRIQLPGMRVKVISADEASLAPALSQEADRFAKSKGVTVVDGRREARTAAPDGEAAEKYAAPSVRFRPGQNAQVEVTIPRHVCEALAHHCRQSNRHSREVGGLLVGYLNDTQDEVSGHKFYTAVVTDLIHFTPADSSGTHLRLDADSWVSVSQVYEEKYAARNKVRLGWYHTHPTQGIFFSQPDHDFHTNFNQPFQFAVVINPRSMDAGLTYWKTYENHTTVAPITFSLRRRADASDAADAPSHRPPEAERPPLSRFRISFFAVVTLWVLVFVVMRSESLSPPHACLLALNLLLGLRLLNANFFRPKRRPEEQFFHALRHHAWAGFDRVGPYLERRPGLIFIFAVIIILLLAALLMLKVFRRPGVADVPLSGSAPGQAETGSEPSAPMRTEGEDLLRLNLLRSGPTLSLASNEGGPRVTFRQGRRGLWEPVDARDERAFLNQVLNLKFSINEPSDDVRALQEELYHARAAGAEKLDGVWGSEVRGALLRELIEVQKEGKRWRLPWSPRQPRSVVVDPPRAFAALRADVAGQAELRRVPRARSSGRR
jgi:proteasome lid subunit RPN8/RPN11